MSTSRREFLRNTAILGMGSLLIPNSLFAQSTKAFTGEKVRIGLIGVGLRGQSNLDILAKRDDVEIIAFADPEPRMMTAAQKILSKNNKPKAKEYGNGD